MDGIGSTIGPLETLLSHYRPILLILGVLGLGYLIFQAAFATDVPHIKGIPEPANAVPFYGHVKSLGDDHPTTLQNFSVNNGWPLVQVKFGNRRVIVLNTFEAAQHFIIRNSSATIDRPLFWTFHKFVSNTQGATIGTSPWDTSCKRKRTAIGSYMTRPAIQRNAPLIDIEALGLVEGIFQASLDVNGKTSVEVDPRLLFQRASLNFVLMLCYASRFPDIDDPLLHEILATGKTVSTFRSTNNNMQDYVPLLRYFSNSRIKMAKEITKKRDVWLEALLDRVRKAVASGKPVSCIAESLLKEKGSEKLTEAEIRSINVGLVSGGSDTIATTGLGGLGFLASKEGQAIQQKAYDEIMKVYATAEEAWENCVLEENVEYVVALVREMLRYYCAIQMLPPRKTCKPFEWQGAQVPAGCTVYMNAQAINHDKTAYGPDAHVFRPERWLDASSPFQVGLPYHYSYGAGSRACTAVALSNRILYCYFVRLIVSFRFTASEGMAPTLDYIGFNENPQGATVIPKTYRVNIQERRPREELVKNFKNSRETTSHLIFT
ncbi:phenylacetate 2-hydroxylase [Phyllosticta citrichinensis]|uniref:Phenylacetate 2-hydroxylase n=1 Tax=Phyllosticta citrichinensis TaxID=1130410 RepID=A0ABR1XR38_9PEZI